MGAHGPSPATGSDAGTEVKDKPDLRHKNLCQMQLCIIMLMAAFNQAVFFGNELTMANPKLYCFT
jgi:hypothetical protein